MSALKEQLVPLMGRPLCAGFPSPAEDYVEEALDPARLIVTNPASTFMWRVVGRSMIGAGINDGDYAVVDRSLTPKADDVVVPSSTACPAPSVSSDCGAGGWLSTSPTRTWGR